jgi:hypothetical protein
MGLRSIRALDSLTGCEIIGNLQGGVPVEALLAILLIGILWLLIRATPRIPPTSGHSLSIPPSRSPTATANQRLLDQRFPSFFQAFWLRPIVGQPECRLSFIGTAREFFAVVREASQGKPSAAFRVFAQRGLSTIDLTPFVGTRDLVLYLFAQEADASQYWAESSAGWSAEDQQLLRDPAMLHYIPDVATTPQTELRRARDRYGSNPGTLDNLSTEMLATYRRFARFDAGVLPNLTAGGVIGLSIAAPGNL